MAGRCSHRPVEEVIDILSSIIGCLSLFFSLSLSLDKGVAHGADLSEPCGLWQRSHYVYSSPRKQPVMKGFRERNTKERYFN